MHLLLLIFLATACAAPPRAQPIVLWHTFGPDETALLNEAIAGQAVEATVLPFGRAENRLFATLRRGTGCPDLARVDATWVPALAAEGLLAPPPDGALDGVLPEARELASWGGAAWGVPQAIDGLALIARADRLPAPWPPRTLDELEVAARSLGPRSLSVRADGYWFVPWLRASGGELDPESIDGPAAEAALARYAGLITDGLAPAPDPSGDDAAREAERFRAGELGILVAGPWAIEGLGRETLAIAAFPEHAAPRGGAVYVVPRCAQRPDAAWVLAARLTSPPEEARWASRVSTVPTRDVPIDGTARAFAVALAGTRPLPRDPLTAARFDDLTPAVAAALAGDATPAEALAGVARSWERMH